MLTEAAELTIKAMAAKTIITFLTEMRSGDISFIMNKRCLHFAFFHSAPLRYKNSGRQDSTLLVPECG
jgi:hypothetical protein